MAPQVVTAPESNEVGNQAIRAAAAGVPASSAHAAPAATNETRAEQQRRELIRVLSQGNSLAMLIADIQQFDLRQACRIAMIALHEDPDFDKKLVELVKSFAALNPDQVVRVLTVLESVCAPPRLLGFIFGLKHMEGRVRSKLTLMIARLTHDPQWLRQQLEDENPRVRANAIEGLWDVRAEGLEELLHQALRDPHHRVAANAALALHKIGDVSAVASMYSMLRDRQEMPRRAALWAVGQSRDPRFLAAVEELAENSAGDELTMARRVKEELRTSRATAEFTAAHLLEIAHDRILESGARSVRMSCVADSVGGWLGQAHLNALNFVITEGERQVEDYRLTWLNNEEPFIALIVEPRSWNGSGELLKAALCESGVNESYGVLPYQTPYSPVRGKEHDDAAEVKFENYLEVSKEYLRRSYEVARSPEFALKVGLAALNQQTGSRHLFLLADPSVGDAGALAESLADDCEGTKVHAIVWDNAKPEFYRPLRELAHRSGGRFVLASSSREFTKTLIVVRAAHFGSFDLTWQPRVVGVRESARIVCNSNYGYGEVLLK
jgi:hypothetical protein